RDRLAALLGFDGLTTHARDAMWQADQPLEVLSVVTAALLNLDRLAEDLQVWVTSEFDLIELSERHVRGSMVMPQKKNPYALAFVRGVASATIGRLAGAATLGRTPSGQMDNRIFADGEVRRALDLATETTRLMGAVLGGLTVNRELMARRAHEGWAQATDLAEAVVVETGLDYRAAHRVVGRAVRLAKERGVSPAALSPALLDEAASELVGRLPTVVHDEFRWRVNACVASCLCPGAPPSRGKRASLTCSIRDSASARSRTCWRRRRATSTSSSSAGAPATSRRTSRRRSKRTGRPGSRPASAAGSSSWPSSRAASTNTGDRKSTRLNSSHGSISYAVFCL